MANLRLEPQATDRVLGRGTRLAIDFKWREPSGDLLDLSGYTCVVYVATQDGTLIGNAREAAVSGTAATYQMDTDDLAAASAGRTDYVIFTAVATSGPTVLPPNKRGIAVGDWTGADEFLGA